MTPFDHATYFEQAAMSNRRISHVPADPRNKRFFQWAIQELESDLSSRFNDMSVILEHQTVSETDNLSDNPYLTHNMGFWIIAPISDANDFEKQRALQRDCYIVSLQFYSKIRNDKMTNVYKGYVQGTFRWTPYINLDYTAVGYRCTYMYQEPAPTQLNVADWRNETLVE